MNDQEWLEFCENDLKWWKARLAFSVENSFDTDNDLKSVELSKQRLEAAIDQQNLRNPTVATPVKEGFFDRFIAFLGGNNSQQPTERKS